MARKTISLDEKNRQSRGGSSCCYLDGRSCGEKVDGGYFNMPRYHTIEDPDDEYIWAKMIENEGVEFHTARGLPFTYKIKTNAAGEKLGEMFIDRRGGKTITRGTVVLAYKKALELGNMATGPKKLGVFGASYIYPVFVEIGVCGKPHSTERN